MPQPTNSPARNRMPSLGDVAEHAGVSTQTVSRVANGLTNVEAGTRERVLASMRKLGYRPNRAARALRSGKFFTIGVVLFSLSSYGNMRFVDAIASTAGKKGYSMTIVPVEHQTQHDVNQALTKLVEQAVDGIILVLDAQLIDRVDVELPAGLSIVVVDSNERSDYPQVDEDQASGARQATEHLLALGHETVWHVSGPADSYSSSRREQAWRETLDRARAPIPDVFRGDWTTAAGYHHGREIARRPDITAVFTANDQMALGVLRALHEVGRRIPEEISIVGFDDMAEADSFWPPLTTIHQEFEATGRRAVELLLAEIDGHPEPVRSTIMPMSLVIRSSSGPAPR